MKTIAIILGLTTAALAQIDTVQPAAGKPPDPVTQYYWLGGGFYDGRWTGGWEPASPLAIAPDSLISIYGRYLTNTTAAAPSRWPTAFHGVTVTLSGWYCQILFISPNQINAYCPADHPNQYSPANNDDQYFEPTPSPYRTIRVNTTYGPYTFSYHYSVPVERYDPCCSRWMVPTPPRCTPTTKRYPSPTRLLPERPSPCSVRGSGSYSRTKTMSTRRVRLVAYVFQRPTGIHSHRWERRAARRALLQFFGVAPGYPDGLDQLNIRIPTNVQRGTSVPIAITIRAIIITSSGPPSAAIRTTNTVLLPIN
jgi:hypothetical protein